MDSKTYNIINRVKNGDQESINVLFARYQNRVLRIVRLLLTADLRIKLKMQSMDIIQEVFLLAFKKIKDFEDVSEGSFIHWLTTIVYNYVRDRIDYSNALKRKAPKGELSLDQPINDCSGNQGALLDFIPSEQTTPSQFILKKEKENIIDELLLKLEHSEKEIIILRDLESLSFKEIAAILNKNEDAVRKQYNRALLKLISLVEKSPDYNEYAK